MSGGRRILIVGVGGVGCPTAMALARAGAGTLVLADADRVDISNLHRQILFRTSDAGRPKVEAAAERLLEAHPGAVIETRRRRFDATTADSLLESIAVVVDGSDNFPTRFAANDACVEAGVPLVHASALGWGGQILTVLPSHSACLRCVFEGPPPEGSVPTCARDGVLGPVAGVIGALAAAEASRVVGGQVPLHANSLLTYESRRPEPFRAVPLRQRAGCVCSRGDATTASSHAP